MLVPFVIDAESLVPNPLWSNVTLRACHEGLLDVWRSYGLLAHNGEGFDGSRLQKAVHDLPQKQRSLWEEMMVHGLPMLALGNDWSGNVDKKSLTSLPPEVRVAVVDDTKAEVEFSVDEESDRISIKTKGGDEIEISRIQAVSRAKAFQDANLLSDKDIEASDTYQHIWESRFKQLARAPIKNICIVDRYAIHRHRICPQTQLSGLERFVRLLDLDATGPRYLTLYSARTREIQGLGFDKIESDLREILRRCRNNNVKIIKIFMAKNNAFRVNAHDRFIRFEKYAWNIGTGLEVFEGSYDQMVSARFKSGPAIEGCKDREDALSKSAGVEKGEVAVD